MTDETEVLERIDQVLWLQPGDRVILTVREGWLHDLKLLKQTRDALNDRFPDVEFTVIDGLDITAVIRP